MNDTWTALAIIVIVINAILFCVDYVNNDFPVLPIIGLIFGFIGLLSGSLSNNC